MWIPSHVGNELVDERARQAPLEGSIFDRPLSASDFQSLARPDVTLQPWFEVQKEERRLVCTVSRVLSGHCSVGSHLGRPLDLPL
jgi:hypothetical protein